MLNKLRNVIKLKFTLVKNRIKCISIISIFFIYFKKIGRGFEVYRDLLNQYGNDTHIYIEHYPGTGDIYITCALLEAYRSKQQIIGDYVLTVIGQGGKKIAKLLGIQDIVLLSQNDSDCLIFFLKFIGPKHLPNIEILHYCAVAMHTCVSDMLAGYQGLDFMSMYLSTVFPGVTWADAVGFGEPEDMSTVEEYFDCKGLIPGETVILFPFANTIQDLPWHLWERLARHLRENGFTVCTNIEPGREPVPGTCDVFVPYQYLRAFAERAGYVVGIRSGIFDIISNANCRKFVLYPTPNIYKFGVGTIFEYFSLRKMGVCTDAFEYDFERIYDKNAFHIVYRDLLKSREKSYQWECDVEETVERHVHCVRSKMREKTYVEMGD